MLKPSYPLYLANEAKRPNDKLEVFDKYSSKLATRVPLADHGMIDSAIAAAHDAQDAMRAMRPYERQKVLQYCVDQFTKRQEELAYALCIEAGKPFKDAKGEVTRLIDTFRVAAEEATRMQGEVINLEISERARGYSGMTKRVPIGPCAFISPFNFPLNLVAHKIAPALAVGCPFVLKPASYTPIGALIIGEILAETDLPKGAFSILPCDRKAAEALTVDERIKLLSFTGSPDVGWALKARAGKKRVVLELGGNAACVVDEDLATGPRSKARINDALDRITTGAFYQSGQSCISVQRILVHASIYDEVKQGLIERTNKLQSGNPQDEKVTIGPLITEDDAKRVETWVKQAVDAGAKVLCGGKRQGAVYEATLVENVPPHVSLCKEEVFGPVACLSSYQSFDEALQTINASRFGLQAGLFVRDIGKINKAWNTLEVGGVVIGDAPSWRVDNMPYGGVKDSGLGREGIRYAMEDMTELRLLVVRDVE